MMKNLINLMNKLGAGFTTQYAIGLPAEVKLDWTQFEVTMASMPIQGFMEI